MTFNNKAEEEIKMCKADKIIEMCESNKICRQKAEVKYDISRDGFVETLQNLITLKGEYEELDGNYEQLKIKNASDSALIIKQAKELEELRAWKIKSIQKQ